MMGRPGGGGGGGWGRTVAVPAGHSRELRSTLRKLVLRLRPELWLIAIAVFMAIASVAFTVLGPWILGNATNVIFDGYLGHLFPAGLSKLQVLDILRARGHGQYATLLSGANIIPGVGINYGNLAQLLGFAIAVYCLGSIFSFAQGYIMAGVAQRTVYGLRREVEEKLARLPLQYFDSHPHGDILSRVTNDIDNITTTLQQGMSQLLTALVTILGVLVMMLVISAFMAVISLVTVPLSIVVTLLIARRAQREFTAQWRSTGVLNGHVEQMHTGHALVQVYGRTATAIDEFNRINEEMYRASFRAQFLSGIIQPAMQFIGNLNFVLIAVVGGIRVVSGALSLGSVVAFIQYSRQFTQPITQLAGLMNSLQSGLASSERVFEFLEAAEEEPDVLEPVELPVPQGNVSLENISFRYSKEKPLIEGFSLEAHAGETIAIVGRTGAGKTTIVNLLMRFYEIESGVIRLDGIDTRSMTRDGVRNAFGMVLQDTWLFTGTIHDNIAYGKPGATEEEIVAAVEAAFVDHFAKALPEGLDTVLDQDSGSISSGQRQLITIARSFLRDSAILILDEATSNVDTRTEVLIQDAMARLRRGRTSFVIAHRLSTIRNASQILLMENGHIVEHGTHEELLERRGAYFALYNSQFVEAFDDPLHPEDG